MKILNYFSGRWKYCSQILASW